MNQMDNVSDEELKAIEKQMKEVPQRKSDISDAKLVEMVKATERGENPDDVMAVAKTVNMKDKSANYWEVKDLPSGLRYYPDGTKIFARPLKVPEVKKIASMNEDNGDFVLNDILKRSVEGIDINDLYVADKIFIIFWLRANTYRDSGFVVKFICNKCEKKSEYHFEMDNLESQDLSKKFSPNVDVTLPSGFVVKYDYLRIRDELYIERFKEINSEALGGVDDELLAMSHMVKTINGEKKSLLEKYHWLIELDPGDYAYLKGYMEKYGMGIKPYVNVNCNECGGSAIVPIGFQEDFLIPTYMFE